MDPAINPYAPWAGTQPPELIGRANLLENARIALTRMHKGLSTKRFIPVGLCSIGKTVLLNRVEEQAHAAGYTSLRLSKPRSHHCAGNHRRCARQKRGHSPETLLNLNYALI